MNQEQTALLELQEKVEKLEAEVSALKAAAPSPAPSRKFDTNMKSTLVNFDYFRELSDEF